MFLWVGGPEMREENQHFVFVWIKFSVKNFSRSGTDYLIDHFVDQKLAKQETFR